MLSRKYKVFIFNEIRNKLEPRSAVEAAAQPAHSNRSHHISTVEDGDMGMMRVQIAETDLKFKELLPRDATKQLILHHIGTLERDVSVKEIHDWHCGQGWSGIGYHFVVRKDGTVERGRPIDTVGSHAKGFNNRSVGINVVGNFMVAQPTGAQLDSLAKLLADLCEHYHLGPDAIIGHRDTKITECPGDNLYSLLPQIRDCVRSMLNED
jgi:hypothetical protein